MVMIFQIIPFVNQPSEQIAELHLYALTGQHVKINYINIILLI